MTKPEEILNQLLKWISENVTGSRKVNANDIPSDINIDDWEILDFPERLDEVLRHIKFSNQRSFYLGSVATGPSLMQSSVNHRLVRKSGGTIWEVHASGPDFPNGEEHLGTYTSEELRSFIEESGYGLGPRDLFAMGWRPTIS